MLGDSRGWRGEVDSPPARVVPTPCLVLGLLEFEQTDVPIVLSGLRGVLLEVCRYLIRYYYYFINVCVILVSES